MATKKVGIYRKYHGKVPVQNGKPVPKSQWPKKRLFSWVVRWFGADGNRYSRSFKTRKEAKRFAEQKQTEVREGRSDPPPVVRLKDFTREHVKLMRGQTAHNTLREQERCLRKLREVIGDKLLHEVTAKDAETYVNRRHGAGKSASTINKEIMTLRRVFNLAASRRRYLPEGQNPFKKVKKRKVSRKPIRYVSAEEMRRLLAEAPTLRWRAFLTLLYTTGLRLNEACHLTWANIDFENGMLQVSAKRDTTTTVPWEPKDHELRHIPVSPGSLKVLAEWQAEAPEGVPYAFVTLERYRRVMQLVSEGRWHEGRDLINNVLRSFKATVRRAGLRSCTLHDLRRSCITNWARELPAHVAQRLAGHSSLETTVRYYLTVHEEDLERARKVGESLDLEADLTDPLLTHSGQNGGFSGKGEKGGLA